MKKWFVLMCLLCVGTPCFGEKILILTENYKPYQYEDEQGNLTGFGVELVNMIFKEARIEMQDGKIRIYPWTRAYKMTLKDKNTAAFMTVRNNEREELFQWVGPLAPRKMWLYKLRERKDIQIQTLEEAKQYKIGVYRSAQSDYLIELGFQNLDIIPNEHLNIRKLLGRRFDLMPSNELVMVSRLKDLGVSQDTVEKVFVFDERFDYYLAVNLQTSDAIVHQLQVALKTIKDNGTYKRLEQKYLQ
jgi:polar amino acid transport system substrate-binding protein